MRLTAGHLHSWNAVVAVVCQGVPVQRPLLSQYAPPLLSAVFDYPVGEGGRTKAQCCSVKTQTQLQYHIWPVTKKCK